MKKPTRNEAFQALEEARKAEFGIVDAEEPTYRKEVIPPSTKNRIDKDNFRWQKGLVERIRQRDEWLDVAEVLKDAFAKLPENRQLERVLKSTQAKLSTLNGKIRGKTKVGSLPKKEGKRPVVNSPLPLYGEIDVTSNPGASFVPEGDFRDAVGPFVEADDI